MELSNRKVLLERAKYLMNKYEYNPLFALRVAEQEFKEVEKEGEMENDSRFN